jgi:hypothetical protein
MKLLKVPFSHVYIKLHSDTYDRNIIYQASSLMVNFESPKIVAEKHEVVAEFELNVSNSTMIGVMQYAIDNAGVPYGVLQALGMGYVQIASFFGFKVKNPFKNDGKTFVCSELIGDILIEVLKYRFPPSEFDDLTPGAIYDYLQDKDNYSSKLRKLKG